MHVVAQRDLYFIFLSTINNHYINVLSFIIICFFFNLQLDEINLLFIPNSRNKLIWFYQEVFEPDVLPVQDPNKPGPSRAVVPTVSKTPQGKVIFIIFII